MIQVLDNLLISIKATVNEISTDISVSQFCHAGSDSVRGLS